VSSTQDRPVAALTISIIGLALQALGAMFFTSMMLYGWGFLWGRSMMMGPWMMGGWPGAFLWAPIFVVFTVAVVAIGVMGVVWMNSSSLSRVRTGSTLVLVTAVISFPTMFGLVIGSLLMLIGGILGLTWQPTAKTV